MVRSVTTTAITWNPTMLIHFGGIVQIAGHSTACGGLQKDIHTAGLAWVSTILDPGHEDAYPFVGAEHVVNVPSIRKHVTLEVCVGNFDE